MGEFCDDLAILIRTARGLEEADFVLKNATYVNVFTESLETADIAIKKGVIAGIGTYQAKNEIDLTGKILCPGLFDGHIHLESTMLAPKEAEKILLSHGTVAVVADPHEIANVAGKEGINYILQETENLALDVYVMLPSCVPATPLDESGHTLLAEDLQEYYQNQRVLGLAEMMNVYGTVREDQVILDKISSAKEEGRIVDGHAPALSGKELNAYIVAGIQSDHECSNMEEAKEKLARGQWIMLREGTAAKNMDALLPLFREPYCQRTVLVTDDRHPEDLLTEGHIDHMIRKAIALHADPMKAIKMASLQTAQCFSLKNRGAIAPGYQADFFSIDTFETFKVDQVWKKGVLVVEAGRYLESLKETNGFLNQKEEAYPEVMHSFHIKEIKPKDFSAFPKKEGNLQRVIELIPHELLTKYLEIKPSMEAMKKNGIDVTKDIVKMAVCERHKNTGHIGIGYLKGYGLKKGALACSIAHDSHNLIVVGTNEKDMAAAANCVIQNEGGMAIVEDGRVLAKQPLPIAGLMSKGTVSEVAARNQTLKKIARTLGVAENIDPFMTLAFVSLPVIPEVRLNSRGCIDVATQTILPNA